MSPPTDLGAIPKTTSSPPLAHSELANASQIGISSNSYNRPPREKKRPTRLEDYHSGSISENSTEKPGFFSKLIGRSKSTWSFESEMKLHPKIIILQCSTRLYFLFNLVLQNVALILRVRIKSQCSFYTFIMTKRCFHNLGNHARIILRNHFLFLWCKL